MYNTRNNNVRLGIFVASGVLVFILAIYYLGKMQNLFQSSMTIYSEFNDVKGLQTGNNVRFLGINIGTVSDITIINDTVVLVKMGLDKETTRFISKDAMVEIDNEGVMGSKILTIKKGMNNAPEVENNDYLKSVTSTSIDDVLNEISKTTHLAEQAAKNLVMITEKINSGTGDAALLINETKITGTVQHLGKEFTRVTQQTSDILQKVNSGNNTAAMLINDTVMKNQLSKTFLHASSASIKLDSATSEIYRASAQLNHGNGAINKLLYDSTLSNNIDTVVNKVNYGIDTVVQSANRLKESWILNLFSGKSK